MMNFSYLLDIVMRLRLQNHIFVMSLDFLLFYDMQIYSSALFSSASCPSLVIGRLAMMRRDWRLRTAASTGLLFIPGDCDVDHGWWYWLGLTPNLSTRALWQPPVLSGGPVSRDISVAASSTAWFLAIRDVSGASGRWAKEWEFSLSVPVGLKELFTYRKI
jgi:hypothetical protein